MCPLNVTFLHKFLYRIIIRSMKTFFQLKKSQIINMYKRKDLKKIRKCPINIGWMLIFHFQNENEVFKDLI